MALRNIDTFDVMTGYILGDLYENFPICIKINLEIFLNENDKCENTDKNKLILSETLFWLRDNNFLTFITPEEKEVSFFDGVKPFPEFSCVVLTAKGLDVLKKVPSQIKERKGVGEFLMEATKKGTMENISELVSTVLSTAIKAL